MSLRRKKERRRITMRWALLSEAPSVVAERERFFTETGESLRVPVKRHLRGTIRRLLSRPPQDYERLFAVTVLVHSEELAKELREGG